jgi:hypothetical protein
MAEMADAKRIEELNRNKQAFEDRERETSVREYNPPRAAEVQNRADNLSRMSTSDRAEQESERRESLARQRAAEEKETARRQSLQTQKEVEASASRIAAGKRQYNVRQGKIPFSELTPTEKADVQAEIQKSAPRMAALHQRTRDVKAGNIPFSQLSGQEKEIVNKEVRGTYLRVAAIKTKQQETERKDKYYRGTSLKDQLLHKAKGIKDPWNPQQVKKVQPVTTFAGAAREKGFDILEGARHEAGAPFRDLLGGVAARGKANASGKGGLYGMGLLAFTPQGGKVRRAPKGMMMGELKMFAAPFTPRKKTARKRKGRKTSSKNYPTSGKAVKRTLLDNFLW